MSRKKGVKYLAAVALGMTMLFGTTDGTEVLPLTATMKKPAIMYRPAMQRFIMKFMVRASLFSSFMVVV